MTHKEISNQTRTELANALRGKMALKPLKTISVRELTRDCCLDRHTFYYHFRDIYGLMEWMFQQDQRRLTEELKELQDGGEGLGILLRYLKENRASLLCAMSSIHSEYFDRMLYAVVYGLRSDGSGAEKSEGMSADGRQEPDFCASVFVSIFKSYLRGELLLSEEILLEELKRLWHSVRTHKGTDE